MPNPALQLMPHAPAEQKAVPLVALQTCPQVPQLLGSMFRSLQVPLQLVWPDGQTQLVPKQLPPTGQVVQIPLQLVWPDGQTQLVPEQLPPTGQTTQAPLQLVCPDGQAHLLLVQVPEQQSLAWAHLLPRPSGQGKIGPAQAEYPSHYRCCQGLEHLATRGRRCECFGQFIKAR